MAFRFTRQSIPPSTMYLHFTQTYLSRSTMPPLAPPWRSAPRTKHFWKIDLSINRSKRFSPWCRKLVRPRAELQPRLLPRPGDQLHPPAGPQPQQHLPGRGALRLSFWVQPHRYSTTVQFNYIYKVWRFSVARSLYVPITSPSSGYFSRNVRCVWVNLTYLEYLKESVTR
jgi:hypothetical protein